MEKGSLYKSITKRRDQLIDYIIRHNRFLSDISEAESGKMRGVDRHRLGFISKIVENVVLMKYSSMKRRAEHGINGKRYHTSPNFDDLMPIMMMICTHTFNEEFQRGIESN